IRGNDSRYWYARLAFDSPWYQMAPRMVYGIKGLIIPLKSSVGNAFGDTGLDGSFCAFCAESRSIFPTFAMTDLNSAWLMSASRFDQVYMWRLPREKLIEPMGTSTSFSKSLPKK